MAINFRITAKKQITQKIFERFFDNRSIPWVKLRRWKHKNYAAWVGYIRSPKVRVFSYDNYSVEFIGMRQENARQGRFFVCRSLKYAGIAQLEEALVLETCQCEFESRSPYQYTPVAQRTERWSSKPRMRVRFFPGVPSSPSPTAEAEDLKSSKSGFESHPAHQ